MRGGNKKRKVWHEERKSHDEQVFTRGDSTSSEAPGIG
jgi:hypothetical protein